MIIGIVAVDQQGAIGKDGKLPWHYSADLKFFRETTTGHACVMGHNTWLSLNRPLKNRLNILLSRRVEPTPQESVIVMRNPTSVLSLAPYLRGHLFVLGGAQLFRSFLPYIERWIVTRVPLTVIGADTFVPEDYLDGFNQTDSLPLEENLTVEIYDRTQRREGG